MENIRTLINVIQALVLTELTDKRRMILTPTYHVFDLYQSHQGAASVRMDIETDSVSFAASNERKSIPAISGSASIKSGQITLSVVNVHATLPAEIEIELRGGSWSDAIEKSALTHEDITAHNTFDQPDAVMPRHLTAESRAVGDPQAKLNAVLPPASVTVLRSRIR